MQLNKSVYRFRIKTFWLISFILSTKNRKFLSPIRKAIFLLSLTRSFHSFFFIAITHKVLFILDPIRIEKYFSEDNCWFLSLKAAIEEFLFRLYFCIRCIHSNMLKNHHKKLPKVQLIMKLFNICIWISVNWISNDETQFIWTKCEPVDYNLKSADDFRHYKSRCSYNDSHHFYRKILEENIYSLHRRELSKKLKWKECGSMIRTSRNRREMEFQQ